MHLYIYKDFLSELWFYENEVVLLYGTRVWLVKLMICYIRALDAMDSRQSMFFFHYYYS